MIKIAIVEDNEKSGILIEKFVERYSSEHGVCLKTKRYLNALNFVSETEFDYDVVLLDIEMPHMNGMDAAKYIRKNGNDAQIIFVTNMAQYAVEGYEVNALDFVVKPVSYATFSKKLDRAVRKVEELLDRHVTLFTKEGFTKVYLDKVNYVEVKAHSIIYHTDAAKFEVRSSMKLTEALLKDKGFARCNNCYLVNLNNVYEIRKDDLKVGEEWLPISRTKKKDFMVSLTVFLAGGGLNERKNRLFIAIFADFALRLRNTFSRRKKEKLLA